MKTDAKTWNEYLSSWPKGWYMDDVRITVNGVPEDEVEFKQEDTDVVDVTGGFIFTEDDRGSGAKSLVRSFSAWQKKQAVVRGLFEYPAEVEVQLLEFMTSIGGKKL